MKPSILYSLAFKLLVAGFSVIPSGAGKDSKAPAVEWIPRQVIPATEAELEAWEAELKPLLWGIVTGVVSKCIVIDADDATSRAILENKGLAPHIITPRGGAHFYFQHPDRHIKTCAGILPHIDVRADGGFVNTVGKSKLGEYKIMNLPAADNLFPFSKLPAEIVKAMTAPSELATKPAEPMIEGQRNSRLTSIAGAMRRQGTDQEAITNALLAINQTQCQPPLSDAEVRSIAKSTSRYSPRLIEIPKESSSRNGHRLDLKTLTSVKAETVRWLWEPYIPYGKLTLLEGDPGVGKSWLTLAIVTALSLGHGFPGQPVLAYGPSLIASAEDGLADTIKPRLSAMGANTNIIQAVNELFTLDDIGFDQLEYAICNSEPLPILLVVDPLVAYLSGDMDINKANQVRYAMARLAKIADHYGLAIIAVRHLTKGGSQKPIYRGLGSIDFVASARSVLLAGVDPNAPQSRGFVHIKSNLALMGGAIGYELRDGNFYWLEHTELTQEKILGSFIEEEASPILEAKNIIETTLCAGPVAALEMAKAIQASCIPDRALNKAKKELGLSIKQGTIYRDGQEGKKGGGEWFWKLPMED